eukprot:TRINITY_DN722_c0_g1_i1.p1 TRINITY_DN722_c0_g1~~TRINITY_DN722_c0_g1_i1.p1  ORF type:complete len:125 (-),score=43.52 TRINITY_DN722_c0_g1_i1:20-394(-)
MLKFGATKIGKPQKGFQNLHKALNLPKHKNYLFGIRKVEVEYSSLGAGNSGARKFAKLETVPLSYWNPDVTFETKKMYQIPNPRMKITKEDGTVVEKDFKKQENSYDILQYLLSNSDSSLRGKE